MPGHKRNTEFTLVPELWQDVTEIEGLDDLSAPNGVLLEIERLAARLYGSKSSFLLTCGSTVGNLAAIRAAVLKLGGSELLVIGEPHRSVLHAAELLGLSVVGNSKQKAQLNGGTVGELTAKSQLLSAFDSISDCRVGVITSPSYEGALHPLPEIAEICRDRGICLIADSAHGAHLGFHPYFPENAVKLGADIVIESLHKTLPALGQTSLLHLCSGLVSVEEIRREIDIFQTSSPSYLIMASAEHCLRLLDERGDELFNAFAKRLNRFYEAVSANPAVIQPTLNSDPSKIIVLGGDVPEILRSNGFEPERVCDVYTILLTSICDTDDALERLARVINSKIKTIKTEENQ